MRKNALIFCLLLALLLAPTGVALANMAPPPSVVWLTLQFDPGLSPQLTGMQLIACPAEACVQPRLLQQYGQCQAAGCLPGPVSLSGFETSFGCAGNLCRSTAYPNHGGTYFRLVAEFSDRVRTSDVAGPLPASFSQEAAWNVLVRQADLSITPDETLPTLQVPYEQMRRNLPWLGLSLLVELVVAGAVMPAFDRTDRRKWLSRLLIIFLANLATLPVVWLFFPAFGSFQSVGSRLLAFITLVVVAFYVALLVIIYRSPPKVRLWAIPVTVLVFVVSTVIFLLIMALYYYYSSTIYVSGLPPTLIIALSEAFAVISEALLIAVLSKQPLSARWIWITSLLMNAASFLVGLALLGR